MANYWFKPKSFGYGATPTDWRGWALILGFGAAEMLLTLFILALPAWRNETLSLTEFVVWLVLVALLTIGFCGFALLKLMVLGVGVPRSKILTEIVNIWNWTDYARNQKSPRQT